MSESFWFSSLLGAGIAVAYSVSAIVLGRVAMKSPGRTFTMIVFGGMVARIFVALIILTLILLFAQVDQMTFVMGFFVVFVIGLTVEIVTLHRRQNVISDALDAREKSSESTSTFDLTAEKN
jgi:hypothetical protein